MKLEIHDIGPSGGLFGFTGTVEAYARATIGRHKQIRASETAEEAEMFAEDLAWQSAGAFGRLLEALFKKGVIDETEIVRIIDPKRSSGAKISISGDV